ncbi:hypothetical protein V2J09_005529 [Rumex salicifolius]
MEGGMQEDGASSASGSSLVQFKRSLKHNMSPRSPLSPQSQDYDSIDLAMEDSMVDNSIDHLYNNIYDMASSDMSPSMHSFTTYGNESRIDAELRHLVGAETEEDDNNYDVVADDVDKAELLKDVVVVTKGVDKGRKLLTANKKIGLAAKKGQIRAMSLPRRVDKDKPSLERRNTINEKPPIGKRLSPKGSMKALNSASPTKEEKSLSSEDTDSHHPDLGPYLLKKARDVISHGDNPKKAFDLVLRAKNSFEKVFDQDKKLNLEYVMCLHILASMHCTSEEYESAVPLLKKSIEIIPQVVSEQSYALAKFAGCMQLGDVYAVMGNHDSSIFLYKAALEIQKEVLGEKDARFGETCRYVAQAYVQSLQFEEAERLCQMALETHKEPRSAISIEEAADRRLMGLICDSKGDHEVALQHYSLANIAMSSNNNGQETDLATIDCNIGDAYLALARYDEATISYQKALKVFKSSKGETHPSVGSVFVRLAELNYKVGKFGDSKSYCEKALKIYNKPSPGSPIEEIATGLIELAAIYESMDDLQQSLKLLQKALKLHDDKATSQQSMIAGVEAQMGVMNYMLGNYNESYNSLKNAVMKLQGCGEKSSLQGIALNQLGLTCLRLCSIAEAAELFEEARSILHREYGPCHPDTLGVCSNLAATYDVLGKWDDAIKLLEFVVEMREEKLGTADPVVDDEKRRLEDMLKESRRGRSKKARSLEFLLDNNNNNYSEMAAKHMRAVLR